MPDLTAAELVVIEDAVRAVVDRDEASVRVLAPDADVLYVWTMGYGRHGTVDLVMPPCRLVRGT